MRGQRIHLKQYLHILILEMFPPRTPQKREIDPSSVLQRNSRQLVTVMVRLPGRVTYRIVDGAVNAPPDVIAEGIAGD